MLWLPACFILRLAIRGSEYTKKRLVQTKVMLGERAMSTPTSRTSQQRTAHVNRSNTPTSRRQAESVNRRQSQPMGTGSTPSLHSEPNSHTVTCKICDASYRPAPVRPDLLQVGPDALEAAFMSMCHFCFRCRRPACPACWDGVHRVCAECVQEAELSFRTDVSPLQGTLFPSTASSMGQAATDTSLAPLLICIRAGRFQQEQSLASPIDTHKTVTTVPIQPTHQIQPLQLSHQIQSTQSSQQIQADGGQAPFPFGRHRSTLQTIERVLNVILSSLLVLIIMLVIVAEFSSTVNAQLIVLFHVDIRSEIAYILYIVQQLHW